MHHHGLEKVYRILSKCRCQSQQYTELKTDFKKDFLGGEKKCLRHQSEAEVEMRQVRRVGVIYKG